MFASSSQHIASYYAQSATWPEFPTLQDALDCEILIIGAGFSGLHTALKLAEAGVQNIAQLHADRVRCTSANPNGNRDFGRH